MNTNVKKSVKDLSLEYSPTFPRNSPLNHQHRMKDITGPQFSSTVFHFLGMVHASDLLDTFHPFFITSYILFFLEIPLFFIRPNYLCLFLHVCGGIVSFFLSMTTNEYFVLPFMYANHFLSTTTRCSLFNIAPFIIQLASLSVKTYHVYLPSCYSI